MFIYFNLYYLYFNFLEIFEITPAKANQRIQNNENFGSIWGYISKNFKFVNFVYPG